MAVSLKASEQGLQVVDAARRQQGWTKAGEAWCKAAQAAPASLKRFWLGRPINKETFVAICKAVGVNWQQVAEPEAPERTESLNSISFKSKIDWQQLALKMFAEQRRVTTNPLTMGDGLTFSLDEIFVPLGLIERQQQTRHSYHISPEQGSQLYQENLPHSPLPTPHSPLPIPHSPLPTPHSPKLFTQNDFFEQILHQGRRIAILGEPGAGKTTQLQKIADWVFKNSGIAIWIPLANLQGKTLEEYLLQKWLKDALQVVSVTLEEQNALARLFKSENVWLLLDGMDEMVTSTGNPSLSLANQLTGWVAQARVVLTCRLNVWDAAKNALEGFDTYRNSDFSYGDAQTTDQVGQFIHHWFSYNPKLGNQLRAELDLCGRERLKDMVRNPLRLALLCRTWQRRQGKLPQTKVALYQQFVTALYQWKQERFPTNSKRRKELDKALGRLAKKALAQDSLRFRLCYRFVATELGELDEEGSLFQLALQLGFLNQVGVAQENPDEKVYAFFHPTLQEYFAALAIQTWQEFFPLLPLPLYFEPQWQELTNLWLEREDVPKQQKEEFVKTLTHDLLASPDDDTRWQIAKYLGSLNNSNNTEDIVNTLTNLLQQPEEYTRLAAAMSLGQIAPDNPNAINTLIELLDSSQDLWLRQQVAESLAHIGFGNTQAIESLTNLLSTSQDEWTRFSATKSLLEQIKTVNPKKSEKLNALLLEVKQQPPNSKKRYMSLTKLIDGIMASPSLYNKGQVSTDVYDEALQAVILEICQKIDANEHQENDVVPWVNFLLSQHLHNSTINQERQLSLGELDALQQLEDFKNKHIPGYPEANFQALAERRLAGEQWKNISTTWGIPIAQLSTFYQLCIKHIEAKLKENLQN